MHTTVFVVSETLAASHKKIGNLIDQSPQRLRLLASKKQTIKFSHQNEKNVFHLIAGEVEIRNIQNNLIVANVSAPAILGLSNMFSPEDFFYLQTVSDAELISVPLTELMQSLEEKGLWKDISIILSYYLNIYYVRDIILSQSNVYNIIKVHLEMLWHMNHEKLQDVSVFDYILNRTPVSRSSLNKILKDLVSGGYIKLNRGKLVFLNKLPPSY